MRVDLECRDVAKKYVLKKGKDDRAWYLSSMTPHKMANFSITWTSNIDVALVYNSIEDAPSREMLDTLYGCEKAHVVPIFDF